MAHPALHREKNLQLLLKLLKIQLILPKILVIVTLENTVEKNDNFSCDFIVTPTKFLVNATAFFRCTKNVQIIAN